MTDESDTIGTELLALSPLLKRALVRRVEGEQEIARIERDNQRLALALFAPSRAEQLADCRQEFEVLSDRVNRLVLSDDASITPADRRDLTETLAAIERQIWLAEAPSGIERRVQQVQRDADGRIAAVLVERRMEATR